MTTPTREYPDTPFNYHCWEGIRIRMQEREKSLLLQIKNNELFLKSTQEQEIYEGGRNQAYCTFISEVKADIDREQVELLAKLKKTQAALLEIKAEKQRRAL